MTTLVIKESGALPFLNIFGCSVYGPAASFAAALREHGCEVDGVKEDVIRGALGAVAQEYESKAFWSRSVEVLPYLFVLVGVGALAAAGHMLAVYGTAYLVLGIAHICLGLTMNGVAYQLFKNLNVDVLSHGYAEIASHARAWLAEVPDGATGRCEFEGNTVKLTVDDARR